MFQVKLPQGGHSYLLVGIHSMEKFSSHQKCFSCPLLESRITGQEIYVLLTQNGRWLSWSQLVDWLQGFLADMLHAVVRDAQGSRNSAVREVFCRSRSGSQAPEPEEQDSLFDLTLLFLRILQKALHMDSD